jgi:hypothetical protein
MQLTDEEAVQLLEGLRRNTESGAIVALADWALRVAREWQAEIAVPRAIRAARKEAFRVRRRDYMAAYMRRRRAAQRQSL